MLSLSAFLNKITDQSWDVTYKFYVFRNVDIYFLSIVYFFFPSTDKLSSWFLWFDGLRQCRALLFEASTGLTTDCKCAFKDYHDD